MSPVRRIRTSCTEVVSSLQDVERNKTESQNGITKTASSNPAGIPRRRLERRQEDAITLSITYPYETYTTTVLLGNTLPTSFDPAPSQLLPTRSEEFHIPSPPSSSQFPQTDRMKQATLSQLLNHLPRPIPASPVERSSESFSPVSLVLHLSWAFSICTS
jgi:hypothetical protein